MNNYVKWLKSMFFWKNSCQFRWNRTQPKEDGTWEEWGNPYVLDDARFIFLAIQRAALKKFQQKRSVTNSYSNHHFVHFLCKFLNQSMNYLHSRNVFEGGKHLWRRFVCGMISDGIGRLLLNRKPEIWFLLEYLPTSIE